jgi:hypothetical protein
VVVISGGISNAKDAKGAKGTKRKMVNFFLRGLRVSDSLSIETAQPQRDARKKGAKCLGR